MNTMQVQDEKLLRRYIEYSSSHPRMELAAKRLIDSNPRVAQHLEVRFLFACLLASINLIVVSY